VSKKEFSKKPNHQNDHRAIHQANHQAWNQPQNQELPFIAPCRTLAISAPWRWLQLGFSDVYKAPIASLSYGLIMALMVMSLTVLALKLDSAWIMLSLLCGFVFAAPLACIGTYAISAQIERKLSVSFRRTLRACFKRYIGNELVFILVLVVVFLVWARASSMASIFLPSSGDFAFQEMAAYLSILTVLSLFFLSITFAAGVFSLPMIMHRDVDAITAAVTSVNAVLRNKAVMLLWGLMVLLALVFGILTVGIGLIFLLPAIGHAVWHGYLDTIDASQFPRHKVGITAVPRTKD